MSQAKHYLSASKGRINNYVSLARQTVRFAIDWLEDADHEIARLIDAPPGAGQSEISFSLNEAMERIRSTQRALRNLDEGDED